MNNSHRNAALTAYRSITRVHLADLPTPLFHAKRLSKRLGGPQIYIKRDDLTGLAMGGNKLRKLEYLLAEATAVGATDLVTVGPVQSNHCRQSAAAARLLGLDCHLILNASREDPPLTGNLLLDYIYGATIHHVVGDEYARPAVAERVMAELREAGREPYYMPGGGSNGLGAMGYVRGMLELKIQLEAEKVEPRAVYFASGGGGTHAGMALGMLLAEIEADCIAVLIEPDRDLGLDRTDAVMQDATRLLGIANLIPRNALIARDDQIGRDYAVPTAAGLAAMHTLADSEGILLDPTYTQKSFAALLDDVDAGRYQAGDSVVFVHTGGTPGLFADPTFAQLLRDEAG